MAQSGPWVVPPSNDIEVPANMPPPYYADSVWGGVNVRDDEDKYLGGDTEFLPKYAIYNTNY